MKLLDFYSTTCQPCRLMAPIVENVVSLTDTLVLEKINVFEDTSMAGKYGISSVPTLILVNDAEEEVSRKVGLQSRPQLLDWINNHVK